jgi:hypothetical protein
MVGCYPPDVSRNNPRRCRNLVNCFNTLATVTAMASESAAPGEVFHAMPPGPHGGILQCAISGTFTADCVFGTATTIAYIPIEDTSKELVGAHAGATAVEIRNAVEVRT